MYLVIKLCNTLASLEEESADKSRLDSNEVMLSMIFASRLPGTIIDD